MKNRIRKNTFPDDDKQIRDPVPVGERRRQDRAWVPLQRPQPSKCREHDQVQVNICEFACLVHVCGQPNNACPSSSKFQPSTLLNDIKNFGMENDNLWNPFTVMIVEFSKECFRIIGLEETASSCQSILEPSFNNQVTWRRKNSRFKREKNLRIFLVFCVHLIKARRKKAANWKKKSFAHFLGLLSPPDRVWFKWFNSYFVGDDDIRLGHDLHHVSHYNHQVIWDDVFYLIGIFSNGPFQYHQLNFILSFN